MSFYEPNVIHPIAEANQRKSGTQTATSSWVNLNSKAYGPSGVWVMNDDDTNYLRVRLQGQTTGILLAPTQDRFFPVDSPDELQIKNEGTDVVCSYWVG